jgi:protein involved in polysaccharide export with SLBB domain
MKRLIAIFAGFFLFMTAFAQENSITTYDMLVSSSSGVSSDQNSKKNNTDIQVTGVWDKDILSSIQLAMSTPDYKVTAGDVYELAFYASDKLVTNIIFVDSSYKIRVSNLAVIDVSAMTFPELKKQVESIVSKNYPFSGVQFALKTPASFLVVLKGEISYTSEQPAWALTRLSSVLSRLTPYSSIRDIVIQDQSGKTTSYDLFKSQRDGNLSQDPYLRPGDRITINRIDRQVKISGAVERPGTYQLIKGEQFSDLIIKYANGYTALADKTRIEMTRHVGAKNVAGDKVYLSAIDNIDLQNYDEVVVPQISELLPVMFLEGAVAPIKDFTSNNDASSGTLSTDGSPNASTVPENSAKIAVRFNVGENYSSLVRTNRGVFTSVSDTASAYIKRGADRIPVNVNLMLYDASYRSEYFVQENDILVIPFRQYFVSVSGAVVKPGHYPYIPDRDWRYYVDLAGGFVVTQNFADIVKITDLEGKTHHKSEPILPEYRINASSNSFLFYFNQYAPIVTTILSIVSTSLTLYAVIGR